MKNRLLDRILLAEVRNTARSVEVMSTATGSMNAIQEVSFNRTHQLELSNPGEPNRFSMTFTLSVVATNAEEPKESLYQGSVQMRAVFVGVDDHEIEKRAIDEQAHSIARFVYPLARMELFRLLAGAKLQDRALPWDLGPEIAFAPDSENASTSPDGFVAQR